MTNEELKKKLSGQTLNVFRTTQRNNIDLTAIADNKANVLLSLNAILLTFVMSFVVSNKSLIDKHHLWIPIILFVITCFVTMFIAAQVLKPSDFDKKRHSINKKVTSSPFFFGNYYKMEAEEYYDYLRKGLAKDNFIKAHLAQDLYYIGRRLGIKMSRIRMAFNIFMFGMFATLISIGIILVIHNV